MRAVADPKTELITDGITRITRDGIVTADGTRTPADVIVYATGFHVTDSYTYVQIKGQHGEDLVDRWNREGIGAHRGITVADVPNLFFLLGPNTGLGHNSVVFMIESQIRYVADAIAKCDKMGAQALAPTRAAQDRFNDELQAQAGASRCGTAAAAAAGTSTSTARTPCSGAATPGSTGGHPLGQARRVPVLRGGHRFAGQHGGGRSRLNGDSDEQRQTYRPAN